MIVRAGSIWWTAALWLQKRKNASLPLREAGAILHIGMIMGGEVEQLCRFVGILVYSNRQASFDEKKKKKITVTSTNGNCDRIAREIARTSYGFFITRPGNAKIGIILPAHRKYKVIPRHSPERYNTIEVNDDAEF